MNNLFLIKVASKEIWEETVKTFPEANFLQSWNWGVFQESLGKKVYRLAWQANDGQQNVIALAQVVVEKAKRGSYLSLAGGPLLDWSNQELVKAVFAYLKTLAKENHCWFVRFRPQASIEEAKNSISAIDCRQAPMHLTADLTIQLDLTLPDEQLLAQMRKNHRQMIRKAQKLGITTLISTDKQDMKAFFEHQVKLAKQHGFVPFGRDFLSKQFQVFNADNQVALVHAMLDGQLLASAFVIFYNHEAVYHYGISTDLNQKLPGSYACQWAVMMEAKKRGCTRYNLWGVASLNQPHHRFAGVGTFKRGFGGQEVAFLPAKDIMIDRRYYLTWFFEVLRKKMRRL